MNEIFNFRGQDVRTVIINNEPYFVGKDVADILGYAKHGQALKKHVDEDDKEVSKCDTPGGKQDLITINESGKYSLVLSSELPQAKEFKRWVTSEVLPTIRKHGMFATDELLDNPYFAIATLQKLKEEREAKKLLEATNDVSASHTSILVGEFAKIMRQNGADMDQNRMFAWLRENGYLISRKGSDRNMPTQKSMELGLFEIKETTINHSDGHISISKTPKITGKGQLYFTEKILGDKDKDNDN